MIAARIATGTALIAFSLLAACSTATEELAGRPGGDETGNGLTALVVDRQGIPVKNQDVSILPLSYLESDSGTAPDPSSGILSLRTDSLGILRVDSLPVGTYHLETRDSNQGIIATVTIDSSRQDLGVVQEQPLGSIAGRVALADSVPVRVRVWGSRWITRTDSNGNFAFKDIPSGTLRLIASTKSDSVLGESVVEVQPGFPTKTTLSNLPPDPNTWDRSAQIEINTTATGAETSESLLGFPVLVRLDATNFPFTQARPDGSDLGAQTLDGKPVPLDVSWWDAQRQTGLAWIRPDTLASQSKRILRLTWGKNSAPHHGAFDTASGWSGVWHMSSLKVDSLGRIRTPDATAWKQDGILRQAGLSQGALSRGILFSSLSDRLVLGSAGVEMGQRSYTWEAWVQVDKGNVILMERSDGDTLWESGEKRIQLGDRRYGLHGNGPGLVPSSLSRLNSNVNFYANYSYDVLPGQWNHLVVRQTAFAGDSVSVKWYVNGIPDTTESVRFLPEKDDRTDSLRIGRCDAVGNLGMEELRLSRVARSDAWIRLSWESQRPGSALVRILPP